MQKKLYKNLNPIQKKLLQGAVKVMKNAHNPYSSFFVGCTILGDNNKIVSGVNVENSAYGSTICAEASALVRAQAEGIKKIKQIAIIAKNKTTNLSEPITPCGNCRQIISEFSKKSKVDIEIIMSNTKIDKIIIAKISELLPLAFVI